MARTAKTVIFFSIAIAGATQLCGALPIANAAPRNSSAKLKAIGTKTCEQLAGLEIERSLISMPTQGAVISSAKLLDAQRPGAVGGAYCQVDGIIRPVDPKAPPIKFNVALPTNWNRKAIQMMGGGYDGTLVPASGAAAGEFYGLSAVGRGYVGFGSDGGHEGNGLDGSFALNNEAAENFFGDQLRKVRDVTVRIITLRYGAGPTRTYAAGGSGGGREALYAADRWPNLYDGVIAYFPVWTAGGLFASWISSAKILSEPGAWSNPAKQGLVNASVISQCDALDGAKDGLVSNVGACKFDPKQLRCPTGADEGDKCLSDRQIDAIERGYNSTVKLPYKLANGIDTTFPYNGLDAGAPLFLGFRPPASPAVVEMAFAQSLADPFVRFFIKRDASYNSLSIDFANDPAALRRFQYISSRMDVNPDLSVFAARGGKVLIVHGLADQFISSNWSIEFRNRAVAAMGEKRVAGFLKLYRVPGFAHGTGGPYLGSADMLTALDGWVERGIVPRGIVNRDMNEATKGRTRPLCEYPTWPRYKGGGDVNAAASFTCTR